VILRLKINHFALVENLTNRSGLNRKLKTQFVLLGIVIVIGLLSRKYSAIFPLEIQKYPGSALWALAVFIAIGFLLKKTSIQKVGVYALVVSFAVEFSQLLNVPWLNELRSTKLGHLFLGSTFNPPDFVAYTLGVGLGVGLEMVFFHNKR
jgi:Protein of unknown function (DUF2809)